MALSVTVVQDWYRSSDYSETTTTPGISVSSGDWLVAVGTGYATADDGSDQTWVIDGSSVTPSVGKYDGSSIGLAVSIVAWKATSTKSVTVSLTQSFYGAADPSVKVYKVTGGAASVLIGASGASKGTVDPYNPTITTTDASSVVLGVGLTSEAGTPGHSIAGVTSSTSTDVGGSPIISGFKAMGSVGSHYLGYDAYGSPNPVTWLVAQVEILPPGAASLTASATLSSAASLSGTATVDRVASASLSSAAALSGAASVDRAASASLSSAAALSATATVERAASAALSSSALLTATLDVTPPAGTVTAETTLSSAAALSATAAVDRPASATLSSAASLTATLTVERSASVTLSSAATFTVAATIPGQVPTTPGTMRAVSVGAPTLRPAAGPTLPRLAAIVAVDTATMTILASTTAPPADRGIAVFYGGDSSPEDAGLVPAGTPYLWISGGTLYYEDGS